MSVPDEGYLVRRRAHWVEQQIQHYKLGRTVLDT
jgi:hypothetical protein